MFHYFAEETQMDIVVSLKTELPKFQTVLPGANRETSLHFESKPIIQKTTFRRKSQASMKTDRTKNTRK